MRVDRTASTKVPSARESRASVACQYCAAACAEMFFPNLVCVSPMLDELKLAQSEEQIYPERSGKPKDAKPAKRRVGQTSPGAGSGSLRRAGAGCGEVITRMTAVRMTPAARTVRRVIVSPTRSQPRNNATTGLTNAYVATRAAVLLRRM